MARQAPVGKGVGSQSSYPRGGRVSPQSPGDEERSMEVLRGSSERAGEPKDMVAER